MHYGPRAIKKSTVLFYFYPLDVNTKRKKHLRRRRRSSTGTVDQREATLKCWESKILDSLMQRFSFLAPSHTLTCRVDFPPSLQRFGTGQPFTCVAPAHGPRCRVGVACRTREAHSEGDKPGRPRRGLNRQERALTPSSCHAITVALSHVSAHESSRFISNLFTFSGA